jgi:rRNA maturation RNase YbeY
MNIAISNRQNSLRLDRTALRELIRACLGLSAGRGRTRAWGEISVVVSDHKGIRELNRRHLGRDAVTDVLAFALPPLPGEDAPAGELIVNAERALELGRGRLGGPAHELAFYLAHACDHLGGATDHDPAARRRMQARERRWLRRPDVAPHAARLAWPT